MKAVLIDDELASIETLEWLIKGHVPTMEIIYKSTSPMEGITFLEKNTPDVLFLDIQMAELNGFELLSRIEKIDFEVIFVTAYDQYAIKAMKANALDYLLKPVASDDLISAIQRLENKRGHLNTIPLNNLKATVEQLKTLLLSKRIAISTTKSYEMIDPDEILYCESDGNYTKIHLVNDKNILMSKTLKLVEEALPKKEFLRIHNSIVVNVNHIRRLVREDGGYLIMDNNKTLELSKSKREDLLKKFHKF